jgi:sugar/nucleoside kinase (ribokinase family)
VVTLGAGGAVWSDGTSVRRCAVDAVVPDGDPVGAGDAFTAGLLRARLAGAAVDAQLTAGCTVARQAMAGT